MADKKETSGWEQDMRLNTIFLFLVFVLVLFVCFLLLKFNQAIVLLDLLFVDIQVKVGFLILVSFLIGSLLTFTLEMIYMLKKKKSEKKQQRDQKSAISRWQNLSEKDWELKKQRDREYQANRKERLN